VDLSDAIPKEMRKIKTVPHMTILFRTGGFQIEGEELKAVRRERGLYLQQEQKSCLSFTLEKWQHAHSDRIRGELADFCQHLREKFKAFCDSAVEPHVSLRPKVFKSRNEAKSMQQDAEKAIPAPLSQQYRTDGSDIRIMGNAVVLYLLDAQIIPCEVRDPHMTILFRKTGYKSGGTEIKAVIDARNEYMKDNDLTSLTFKLSRWGKCSDLIHGKLADMCHHIREKLHSMHEDARKPHVAVRRKRFARRR